MAYGREILLMAMAYLVLAMSLFLIRIAAGYDSRYQKGRYIPIKNTAVRAILLDNMSIYTKTARRKKDKNKMSVCGLVFYVALAAVLTVNAVFLILPDIPCADYVIDTGKFIAYADTLNDKLSIIAILLLFLAIVGYLAVVIMRVTKEITTRWIKWLGYGISGMMLLISSLTSAYLLVELIVSLR